MLVNILWYILSTRIIRGLVLKLLKSLVKATPNATDDFILEQVIRLIEGKK